jgi:hypothetical protein
MQVLVGFRFSILTATPRTGCKYELWQTLLGIGSRPIIFVSNPFRDIDLSSINARRDRDLSGFRVWKRKLAWFKLNFNCSSGIDSHLSHSVVWKQGCRRVSCSIDTQNAAEYRDAARWHLSLTGYRRPDNKQNCPATRQVQQY